MVVDKKEPRRVDMKMLATVGKNSNSNSGILMESIVGKFKGVLDVNREKFHNEIGIVCHEFLMVADFFVDVFIHSV